MRPLSNLEYDPSPSPEREAIFDHGSLEYAPVFEKLPEMQGSL
jgi:hypothetical protein